MASPETPKGSLKVAGRVRVDPSDLRFSFARSSGPGGQAVNKLATKVRLRVAMAALQGLSGEAAARLRRLAGKRLSREDEIVLASDIHRTQEGNRRACLERLSALVARALVAPIPRRRSKPTRASVERRLAAKRRGGERKQARRRPGEDV